MVARLADQTAAHWEWSWVEPMVERKAERRVAQMAPLLVVHLAGM